MKRIAVSSLKPGQKYSRTIYIDNKNILAGANQPILEQDLEKLRNSGVSYVETDGMLMEEGGFSGNESSTAQKIDIEQVRRDYDMLLNKKDEFLDFYDEAVEGVQNLIDSLQNKKPFENNIAIRIVNTLIQSLGENRNIFIYIPTPIEMGSNYLASHLVNTCIYSLVLGSALNYSKLKLQDLGMGALLFDIGMIKVPESILNKEGKLTDDEKKIIHSHPVHGYKMLTQYAKVKTSVANVALMHQERFDGSGYPRGLKGNNIDEYARIVAIADYYEALTRQRTYRDKHSAYDTMKKLLSAEINKLDPVLLKKFLARMAIYPIGSLVKLNNEVIGVVIYSLEKKPLRPVIKVVVDEFGDPCLEPRVINLLENSDLYIVHEVDESDIHFSIQEAI